MTARAQGDREVTPGPRCAGCTGLTQLSAWPLPTCSRVTFPHPGPPGHPLPSPYTCHLPVAAPKLQPHVSVPPPSPLRQVLLSPPVFPVYSTAPVHIHLDSQSAVYLETGLSQV